MDSREWWAVRNKEQKKNKEASPNAQHGGPRATTIAKHDKASAKCLLSRQQTTLLEQTNSVGIAAYSQFCQDFNSN